MNVTLIPAYKVREGDWLESPCDQVWRPVKGIDRQHGRLYFLMGMVSRSALVDDLVLVDKARLEE